MKTVTKFITLFFLLGFSFAVHANNSKPFVIPEIQQWKGGKGEMKITPGSSIIFMDESLQEVAQNFAAELKILLDIDLKVSAGKPSRGDITLDLKALQNKNPEAYSINIQNQIKVTANESIGVLWATRTLLQMLEQSEQFNLPKGEILDYPSYPMRGFMLDCGRKYFSIDFLRDYVKFMSYYKMNTFQIHLNDNAFRQYFLNDWDKTPAAFRLESETYPGLTSKDGSYTKQEFIDLQILAESLGVNIIPEIDVPAHSLAFAHYLPELGSKEYGMDHLDLFNPNTYKFLDGLFKEYLEGENPVFRGPIVHIGTDEYSNAKKEVVEKFRYFTDYYIRYVEKFGKKAMVWGALTHAKGETPVKAENVLMNAWYNGYADPKEMKKLGYELISIPDGWVYIVPEAGYYYNYLNIENLYKNWTPAHIGKEVFEDNDPQVKGGMFAVWNDHPDNGVSYQDVHHRVWPAMQTLSAKMWTGKNVTVPFDRFNNQRESLSEAPGVNLLGKVPGPKGLVFSADSLKPGDETGLVEIGYNYRVEFTVRAKDNANGTLLFSSPNALVYMREPSTGNIGFSRDGYSYSFNYELPNDEPVRIAIEGDNQSTTLYVNGKLQDKLEKEIHFFDQSHKTKRAYLQTLVFPLEKVGNFTGRITDMKVIKL
ncbi:MAG: family 20 glycosylhydrolase [Bacteroidales bacterium]|nr:family 20 glycosylhydrolase [Bacteroidales bacterium]